MHPDLGGGFGPGYKVAYGYDFMGDHGGAIDAFGTINYYPDNDPRDQCEGVFPSACSILSAVQGRHVTCSYINYMRHSLF